MKLFIFQLKFYGVPGDQIYESTLVEVMANAVWQQAINLTNAD